MLFFIVWLLGSVASFLINGYLRGHADQRFNKNQGVTENPPYIIGQLTCWAWPLQVLLGLIWAMNHYSYASGRGDGLAINTELAQLRKFSNDFRRAEAETFRMMLENNINPDDLDTKTARALTARAIQWDMEEEAAQRREDKGLVVIRKPRDYHLAGPGVPLKKKTDDFFEILDRAGAPVHHSDAYDEYENRKKEEGDLIL